MNKIGIFGGTFNPVHITHVNMALQFQKELELDKVFFIPAYISPFKTDIEIQGNPSANQRIEMLKLALDDYPLFEIDTYEIDKEGVSYTVDTLLHYKNHFPKSELYLLIGADQLADFKKWKDWDKILCITRLCVIERQINYSSEYSEFIKILEQENKIQWLNFPKSDISSSDIRNRILSKLSIDGMVENKVKEYIKKNNLYL